MCFADDVKANPCHQLSRFLPTSSNDGIAAHLGVGRPVQMFERSFLDGDGAPYIGIFRWKIYLSDHVSVKSCPFR